MASYGKLWGTIETSVRFFVKNLWKHGAFSDKIPLEKKHRFLPGGRVAENIFNLVRLRCVIWFYIHCNGGNDERYGCIQWISGKTAGNNGYHNG